MIVCCCCHSVGSGLQVSARCEADFWNGRSGKTICRSILYLWICWQSGLCLLYVNVVVNLVITVCSWSRGVLMDSSGCSVSSIQPSFCISFVKNYGGGVGFRNATCLRTVLGDKHWHSSCKILSLQQIVFSVSVEFPEYHKTVAKLR